MSGTSNVGNSGVYEAGDQRNAPRAEQEERERYKEGKENSHKANDPKDERSIANRLDKESKKDDDEGSKVKKSGNPIDQELEAEEAEILAKKGSFGPKAGD